LRYASSHARHSLSSNDRPNRSFKKVSHVPTTKKSVAEEKRRLDSLQEALGEKNEALQQRSVFKYNDRDNARADAEASRKRADEKMMLRHGEMRQREARATHEGDITSANRGV
jgi:hypothetical protein